MGSFYQVGHIIRLKGRIKSKFGELFSMVMIKYK